MKDTCFAGNCSPLGKISGSTGTGNDQSLPDSPSDLHGYLSGYRVSNKAHSHAVTSDVENRSDGLVFA